MHLGQWLMSCHKKFRWEAEEKVSADDLIAWCCILMKRNTLAYADVYVRSDL